MKKQNVSIGHCPLNTYITHPTGAGPGDLPGHVGVLCDPGYYLWECSSSFDKSTYCNYCEIGNGHCDYFTMTTQKNKVLLTTSVACSQWICG